MPYYKPNLTNNLEINKNLPFIMHIDMNSFFASCEQQENPLLRNKPVGVVPYLNDKSTILAASYEAKALGIKTGTKVFEAKKLCPNIKIVLCDPPKYRYINKKFMKVFKAVCPNVHAKSIDEAYLDFSKTLVLQPLLEINPNKVSLYKKTLQISDYTKHKQKIEKLANTIKEKLRDQVGECIKCSIGVGTNTFIAKVASNINKPNGFYYVDYTNINTFYDILDLQDLHGVGSKIKARLNKINILTCKDFLNCDLQKLKIEFKFWGVQWYLRLRGYECDDVDFKRKSIGHSYHLPKFTNNEKYLNAVILKLTEKTTQKMRNLGYSARGFSIFIIYLKGNTFSKSHRTKIHLNSTKEIYNQFLNLLNYSPYKNNLVKVIGVSTSYLKPQNLNLQNDLFNKTTKNQNLNKALDSINNKYGSFTIYPGTLNNYKDVAPDRISFGK